MRDFLYMARRQKWPAGSVWTADGDLVALISGGVTCEQSLYRKPLPEKKMLNVQPHHIGLCGQRLGDQNLDTPFLELPVGAVVPLAGVGVDRHRGVAASAEGGNIVEGDRVVSLFQVLFCRGADRDVQKGRAPCCSGLRQALAAPHL